MNQQLERLGGAFFQYLFDGKTTHQPDENDSEQVIYFRYLQKRFETPSGEDGVKHISITAEEIAITLKLAQAASLTKSAIRARKDQTVFTADIASDALLEELCLLLETNQQNSEFIEKINDILGAISKKEESNSV